MRTKEKSTDAQAESDDVVENTGGGLMLVGEVIGRRRRKFQNDASKPPRWVITLSVLGDGLIHMADRWCDAPNPSDTPGIGQKIAIPVRIRTFTSKGGVGQSRLEYGPAMDSEEF